MPLLFPSISVSNQHWVNCLSLIVMIGVRLSAQPICSFPITLKQRRIGSIAMSYYPTSEIVSEQRFGFGPKLGQERYYTLSEQLSRPAFTHSSLKVLPSTQSILIKMGEQGTKRNKAKKDPDQMKMVKDQTKQFFRSNYRQQAEARYQQSIHTPLGFQERLIQFWSNHFAISVDNRRLLPLAAHIENDVIRNTWNRNFSEMLSGVTKHPAMLIYLDNQQSIGPNSKLGKRRGKGLNENLAREILELHTLGVGSGYSQRDVLELAKAISGWGVKLKSPNVGFRFSESAHEPGSVTLLGRRYNQIGIRQGEQCLADLAVHASTAEHLARKLCLHFLGSEPKELSADMAQAFVRSKGQLMPMYKELIKSKDIHVSSPVRFRTPKEWLFAVVRSVNIELTERQALNTLNAMGQPPFKPGSPAGWSDRDSDYNSPSALTQRMQVANRLANLAVKSAKQSDLKPQALLQDVVNTLYPDALDEHTATALSKADGVPMKLALLWLSPQFQYR